MFAVVALLQRQLLHLQSLSFGDAVAVLDDVEMAGEVLMDGDGEREDVDDDAAVAYPTGVAALKESVAADASATAGVDDVLRRCFPSNGALLLPMGSTIDGLQLRVSWLRYLWSQCGSLDHQHYCYHRCSCCSHCRDVAGPVQN